VRGDLQRLGIAKAEDQCEPEDHAALLFEVMAGLIDGAYEAAAGADRDFFQKHIAPWITRFFADLECSKPAGFYARVGALGRVFMEIETEAFALPS
jgi:TorA maturation chaperone TorD